MRPIKKNISWVRVIDGGGTGFRRADVCGTEIENFVGIKEGIDSIDSLLDFAEE